MERKSVITKKGKEATKSARERSGAGGSNSKAAPVVSERGVELTSALISHFNAYHLLPEQFDKRLEAELLEQELENLRNPKTIAFADVPTFSPSSASKCERELFYKATRAPKDEEPYFAYQKRWVRNGSAVHAAVQKDLLYAEISLPKPAFRVDRMEDGSPAWEHNLKNVKQFDVGGVRFQIYGMMDGILRYKDGSRIGFEYKTKSTTLGAIGEYKMKDAQDGHKEQCVAYSLLFGIEEYLITYESLAKDSWSKGEEAKPDIRSFYFKVEKDDRDALLAKFARVTKHIEAKELPAPEYDKCIFCPFKSTCRYDGVKGNGTRETA